MEAHLRNRPRKNIFTKTEQKKIFKMAKNFILKDILPNPRIDKILMLGSLVKGTFGKYERPFKSRLYSDIDVLIMVDDDFSAPKKWKPHFSCRMYDVFDIKRLDNKIPVQYIICRKKCYSNKLNQKEAEKWGVPLLLGKSRHKHIILYER